MSDSFQSPHFWVWYPRQSSIEKQCMMATWSPYRLIARSNCVFRLFSIAYRSTFCGCFIIISSEFWYTLYFTVKKAKAFGIFYPTSHLIVFLPHLYHKQLLQFKLYELKNESKCSNKGRITTKTKNKHYLLYRSKLCIAMLEIILWFFSISGLPTNVGLLNRLKFLHIFWQYFCCYFDKRSVFDSSMSFNKHWSVKKTIDTLFGRGNNNIENRMKITSDFLLLV